MSFLWGRLSACGPDFIRSTGRRPAFLVAAPLLCGAGGFACQLPGLHELQLGFRPRFLPGSTPPNL
jgi:hypothetical protein